MTVVGIQRVDIDRDGANIHGYKYYCTEKSDRVIGVSVDSFFASDNLLNTLKRDITLDDEVIPVYARESKRLRTVVFDS